MGVKRGGEIDSNIHKQEDVPFVVELRDGGPGVDGQAGMSIVAFLVGV